MASTDNHSPITPQTIGRWENTDVQIDICNAVDADVSLTVVGMFTREFVGDSPTGALLRLDQALQGALTRLRADGIFRCALGETMVLGAPAAPVKADAVLIVGLGTPQDWSPSVLRDAVAVAAAEALRLDKQSVAFSPSLSDSGMPRRLSAGTGEPMMAGLLGTLPARRAHVLERWTFCSGATDFQTHADELRSAFKTIAGR
ncbi:M17 family peptidase N-terminal domain-containing protein [Sphingomonas sp. R86521]|uniref:M17 family peptidase N-terminal domain-containing protein n=1 Tax=Sphingomonas sp. R86521 TaxID=3093860 RepID=UPI0036D36BE9